MKSAAFSIVVPSCVDEAIDSLVRYGPDARLLAGGQSLVPAMAMRLVSPAVIVDLGRVRELTHITRVGDHVAIGATTKQRAVERSAQVAASVQLLALAVPQIAHATVRNQGTLGGSIAQAEPTAELPTVAIALDAVVTVAGPNGVRVVPAGEFFVGAQQTCLAHDEMVVEIRYPIDPVGAGWAFEEVGRRPGDVAIVGVAAMIRLAPSGVITEARIAISSVASTPLRMADAEAMLIGSEPTAERFAELASLVAASLTPPSDLNGTSTYRRHLAGVLVRRALITAASRAAR